MADEEQSLKIKIQTTADGTGAKQTEEALRGVKKEAGGAAEEMKKGSASAKEFGKELKEGGKVTHELEAALAGLERGGLGGFISAAKNAGKAIAILATSSIGAVLIPVLAVAGATFLALNKAIEHNREAMKKTFEENAKAAEAYQKKVEELKKSSEKALKEMTADVEKLAAAYKEVVAQIDEAAKRQDRLGKAKGELATATLDTDEKKALAKATSPEQREAIKRDFQTKRDIQETRGKVGDLDNTDLGAFVQKKNAEEAISAARRQNDEAAARTNEQRRTFEGAQGAAADLYKASPTSAATQAAQKRALAEREGLKQAEKNQKEVGVQTSGIIKQAQEQIDAAKLTVEETGLRRKTYQKIIEGKLSDLSTGDKEKEDAQKKAGAEVAGKEKEIKDAKDAAFAKTGLTVDPNIKGMEGELAKARDSQAKAYTVVVQDAQARKKESDGLRGQMKVLKERTGGG